MCVINSEYLSEMAPSHSGMVVQDMAPRLTTFSQCIEDPVSPSSYSGRISSALSLSVFRLLSLVTFKISSVCIFCSFTIQYLGVELLSLIFLST